MLWLCSTSIVHAFVEMFGIKVNKFNMVDPNTFYLVNGVRRRTAAVQQNPDVLHYRVQRRERGRSAEELKEQALQPVNTTQTAQQHCIIRVEQHQPVSTSLVFCFETFCFWADYINDDV